MKGRCRTVVTASRGIFLALLAFAAVWSGVYWFSAAVRRDVPGAGASFAIHLLTLLVAFLLASAMAFFAARLFSGLRQNPFLVLNEAMKRIGSGDFSVNVPVEGESTPFHEVASNLNQMASCLKQLEDMRQEFISNVSHEIQSPLTSITGFARALHDAGLSDAQRADYLDIIEAESRRLSRLSDSLLKLTSLESKTQPLERRRYRLDSQLRSVALGFEPQWSGKGIDFDTDLPPLSIIADEGMMSQVWGNLIQNSVKFTPAGGRISISLREDDGKAVVQVSDTGIGIGPEDLPYVFDRFYKADKSRSSFGGTSGSGLGLSIVSTIVALHGGTVRAESEGRGRGAAFTVSLPLRTEPEDVTDERS